MVIRYGVAEAKARLSEILKKASAGDTVIVHRRGKPAAVIRKWSSADEEPAPHWSLKLWGIAEGLHEFDRIMREVVESRDRAGLRPVDLEKR